MHTMKINLSLQLHGHRDLTIRPTPTELTYESTLLAQKLKAKYLLFSMQKKEGGEIFKPAPKKVGFKLGGGLQLVRCGPATELQPRLPHGLHCQLSSMIVRVTQTVFCSSFLPSSLDGVRVGLHLPGSGHCRLWTEFGA